jgi:hypothetical protein
LPVVGYIFWKISGGEFSISGGEIPPRKHV